MLITTIPKAVKGREALRNTWFQHSKNNTVNIRHVFLFGGGWSKQWALKFCNHAKFTLRTGDDNYINLPEIVKWVKTKGPKNLHVQIDSIITGIQRQVYRKRDKKWFVNPLEYPEREYPTYSMGTAFMFSMVAIKDIVKAAPNVPFFAIEDAWFGLLMREIKMGVVNEPGFDKQLQNGLLKQLMDGKCPDKGKFLSIHLVSTEGMQLLWNQCSFPRNLKQTLTTPLTPLHNSKTVT